MKAERLTARDEKTGTAYYPQCFEEPCFGMGCEKKECLLKYAVVEKLAKYEDLEEQGSHNRWIACSERLPEENGTYLCTFDGELVGQAEPFTGMCGFENGEWDEKDCVIAWQEMPEPWKG